EHRELLSSAQRGLDGRRIGARCQTAMSTLRHLPGETFVMSATKSSFATSFYIVGGTVRRDALCYVQREADSKSYKGLKRGRFGYVLTSRQMGKSSLMIQTAAHLREEGVAVAMLDLTAIGQNLNPEQWYGGLLIQLGQQLGLEDELSELRRQAPRPCPT